MRKMAKGKAEEGCGPVAGAEGPLSAAECLKRIVDECQSIDLTARMISKLLIVKYPNAADLLFQNTAQIRLMAEQIAMRLADESDPDFREVESDDE